MSYGSDGPSLQFPELTPAIKRLLLANGAVFVLNMILAGRLSSGPAWFACSLPGLLEGYGLGLLRLLSYQFTHSFDAPGHIFFNMLALYFFGTFAEASLGYRGTLKLYLLGGLAGAGLHLLLAASRGYGDVPLVGASGACYAFLLYAASMAPRMRVIVILFPVPLGVLAGVLVFFGVYEQYVELVTGASGGTAHGAHLGGAALGFFAHRLGWFRDFRPYGHGGDGSQGFLSRLRQRWAERQRKQASAKTAASQQEIDRILAKIQALGLPSITELERKTLARASEAARRR